MKLGELFLHNYLTIEQVAFLHILCLVLLTAIAGWVSNWLRPHQPNPQKLTTYESGMEPLGHAWGPVNTRLYLIGIIFVLFELETILLFPWASVWISEKAYQPTDTTWNLYMAVSGTFFILVLGMGLMYAIIKSRLAFSSPTVSTRQFDLITSKVPLSYYEKINAQYANPNPTVNNQI